jgi:2-iminobutanoate/2-iminopropanoate deaminase
MATPPSFTAFPDFFLDRESPGVKLCVPDPASRHYPLTWTSMNLSTPLCATLALVLTFGGSSCGALRRHKEAPDYFLLRPQVEKEYGYSHAVRLGNEIKISGAVSMDDKGQLVAAGDMAQQMKNCYRDLELILKHYGCTFDDVVVENVFTTDMAAFIQAAGYRASLYKKNYPTGTWLEVKGLALPGQLIEIDMEARIPR